MYCNNANESFLLCNHAAVLQRRCHHDILRQCEGKNDGCRYWDWKCRKMTCKFQLRSTISPRRMLKAKKVTRSKMLARIVTGETMMIKIDEPNAVLEKFSTWPIACAEITELGTMLATEWLSLNTDSFNRFGIGCLEEFLPKPKWELLHVAFILFLAWSCKPNVVNKFLRRH